MGSLNAASGSAEPIQLSARVLVVEDEPIVGMDIEAILAGVGLQVIGPVTSSAEALELIGTVQVDCALIDYVLADGDACDVVMRLAEFGIPFVFVTGVSRDAIPKAYCDVPTIGKPFVEGELINCVRSMCLQARAA